MSLSLEERIKQLMEAKEGEVTLDEAAIEELEEAKVKMDKDGAVEVDSDKEKDDAEEDEDKEDDSEEESDDEGETDFAKDSGKKNKAEVKEETTPGQSATMKQNGDQSAEAANQKKLTPGFSKRDPKPSKMTDTATADKQDDNGDNAKIQAKAGTKDSGGKVADGVTGSGVEENNARNTVKEHVSALFNGEELSEDFKMKAEIIFEAAVEQVAQARIDALTEEYAQKVLELQEEQQVALEEAVVEVTESMVDSIDGFLNETVQEWLEENRVEVEGGMKVEIVNSFIDGLKQLFQEHYVDVPDEALDIVEEQAAQIDALKSTIAESEEATSALVEELVSLKSALVYESVSDGLTEIQKDKFSKLVEGVEFTSEEEYTQKLETLKESYFPKGKTVTMNESVQVITEEKSEDPMAKYTQAIGKQVRFI